MGTAIKAVKGFIGAFFLIALILGFIAQPVWADPPTPDLLEIKTVKVFHYLIEQDDFLLAFHYNIHYTGDPPTQPANELFIFRLMAANGIDELGTILPYPYYETGYEQGIAAFYFDADDAPEWGQAYILRLIGNPAFFATPPETNYTLVSTNYCAFDTQEQNQQLLGDYVLDVARKLEVNWEVKLLEETDVGTVLNSTGASYVKGAIFGIQVICPQIFYVQTVSPEYEEREWGTEQATTYVERYQDTWIGDAIEGVATMLHVPQTMLTSMMLVAAMIVVMVICQIKFASTTPGLVASACIFLAGAVMGWFPMAMLAIIALLFAMFIGYVFFFRAAS